GTHRELVRGGLARTSLGLVLSVPKLAHVVAHPATRALRRQRPRTTTRAFRGTRDAPRRRPLREPRLGTRTRRRTATHGRPRHLRMRDRGRASRRRSLDRRRASRQPAHLTRHRPAHLLRGHVPRLAIAMGNAVMMRSLRSRWTWRRFSSWCRRLAAIGVSPSDSEELRVRKAVLVLSSALMAVLACL